MTRFPQTLRAFLAILAIVTASSGCGSREAVVVYVSADESVARPVLATFEKKTGIKVEPVFDTEATKTTGLAQRLRSEADRPRADLFWSSEIAFTVSLAEEGVLAPASSPILDAWPSPIRNADGRWFAFAARARVIVYAPDRVPPDRVPAAWTDLAKECFHGRVAMADPRFGTTRTHMAAAKWWWDRRAMPGYFEAWLEGLGENAALVLTSGNAGVVQAVVDGRADLGMTDSDDVLAAQRNGAEVRAVFARHSSDPAEPLAGTLLVPNTVGMVRGARHPREAMALLEYLLSPECEVALRDSASGNYPLGPSVPAASALHSAMPPDPIVVDWKAVAKDANLAAAKAIDAVGPPGGRGS